jgi:hypothetical protein
MHADPVGFMLHHGLYILAAPQMKFLLPGTTLLSLTVQMFKDDGIGCCFAHKTQNFFV